MTKRMGYSRYAIDVANLSNIEVCSSVSWEWNWINRKLSGGRLNNRFAVIPAEAGIQTTDFPWQSNRQPAQMLPKANFSDKTRRGKSRAKAPLGYPQIPRRTSLLGTKSCIFLQRYFRIIRNFLPSHISGFCHNSIWNWHEFTLDQSTFFVRSLASSKPRYLPIGILQVSGLS